MQKFIKKMIERLEERQNDIAGNLSLNVYYSDGYDKGIEYAIEIVTELAEEYKVSEMPTGSEGFCEWKKGKSGVFPIKTDCGNSMDVNYGYEFCPYCGKKIKVAPYTEGE